MKELFPLPNELKEEIFLFLSFRDIFSCYLCGEKDLFFSSSLWRRKAKQLGVSTTHFNLAKKPPHVRYYELYRMLRPKRRKVPTIFLQGLKPRQEEKGIEAFLFLATRGEDRNYLSNRNYPSPYYDLLLRGMVEYHLVLNWDVEFIVESKRRLSSFPSLYSYYSTCPLIIARKTDHLSQILCLEKRFDLYYSFSSFLGKKELLIFLANLICTGNLEEVRKYRELLEERDLFSSLLQEVIYYKGDIREGGEAFSYAAAFSNSPQLIKEFITFFGEEEKEALIIGFLYSPNLNFFYLAREYGLKKEELAITFHPDLDYL